MKAILKISFLLAFLFATLFYNIRFSYLLGFHTLNNESFTELYCENTDNPELECNGKCSLVEAGGDSAEDDTQRLENFQREIPLFYSSNCFKDAVVLEASSLHALLPYQNLYQFQYASNFLHPPSRVAWFSKS